MEEAAVTQLPEVPRLPASRASTGDLLRRALEVRLETVRQSLPRALTGSVQFAIHGNVGPTLFFFELDGQCTALRRGLTPGASCLIRGSGPCVVGLLRGQVAERLKITGDVSLGRRFLQLLATPASGGGLNLWGTP
jgi:hypothetical protein